MTTRLSLHLTHGGHGRLRHGTETIPSNTETQKTMPVTSTWETLLLGLLAAAVLLWMWPGVREATRRSRKVENPDWRGVLLPLAVVVLFVALLILMV